MFPTSPTSVTTVAQIIQLAVAPVFLLAGIGAFLNVCAGRLSRIVDRSRQIEPLLLASRGTEHDRWLGELRVLDHRMALVAVAVQVAFLAVGLVSALRPPPPAPLDAADALGEALMVAFLMAAQLLNAVGARVQRRASRRIDEIIRTGPALAVPLPGGKRWYDGPPTDPPSHERRPPRRGR